jgi:hypothetical protein
MGIILLQSKGLPSYGESVVNICIVAFGDKSQHTYIKATQSRTGEKLQ